MKEQFTYTNQHIEKLENDIIALEDDILALKVTVHVLLELLSQTNHQNLSELIKKISFETNRFEREYPELPGTKETLNMYYNQLIDIYKSSKND
ncbi:hypothetical protein I2492_05890 [Budviciaceae bacterium CWB-B4]|uniref:Uncharacterized protein n=1 Tax=Limnobaculum xujianqingii TaxID=2738837 RepID=A0A9D7FSB6_9GAMM|nr:hypothetical protein [Limnobaculum xujianqingii]MBK5072540.1 hypothetical protein [Limnobaculum xujianqingii]MBK5175849.1 hypothetical protein [Limnobaculum xujianqingii]